MLRKSIALILAACLSVTALTACGEETPAPNTSPTTAPTVAPTTAPKTDPTTAPTGEPEAEAERPFGSADLKGVTIKTHNLENPAGHEGATQEIWLERQKDVEENFNVNLTFAALGDATWTDIPQNLISSVASGDPLCDVLRPSMYYVATLMINDLLEDMTDAVLDYDLPESYYAQCWWDGRLIGFDYNPIMTYEHLIYDRGIILDVGMEKTPGEMFVEGKWSWDDFYTYLRDLKSKLPEDVMPFYSATLRWARRAVAANGSSVMDPKTNLPLYNTEAYFQGLELMQKLIAEGLAKPPHVTGANEDGSPIYSTAQGTYVFGENLVMTDGFNWNYATETYTNMDWGIAPYPWGPNVKFNEDFTSIDDMLEGYYSTNHDQSFFGIVKGKGSGFAKATAEDYMNIVFTYCVPQGNQLLVNRDRIANGLKAVDATYGTERNFQTELDILLYDWYRSIETHFNPQDTLYPSGASPLSYGAALTTVWTTNTSPRTAFEAIYASDCAKMIDSGLLDKSLLDSETLAEVEEILEQMAEEAAAAEAEGEAEGEGSEE